MRDAGTSDDPHPTREPSQFQLILVPVHTGSSSYWYQFILVPVHTGSSPTYSSPYWF